MVHLSTAFLLLHFLKSEIRLEQHISWMVHCCSWHFWFSEMWMQRSSVAYCFPLAFGLQVSQSKCFLGWSFRFQASKNNRSAFLKGLVSPLFQALTALKNSEVLNMLQSMATKKRTKLRQQLWRSLYARQASTNGQERCQGTSPFGTPGALLGKDASTGSGGFDTQDRAEELLRPEGVVPNKFGRKTPSFLLSLSFNTLLLFCIFSYLILYGLSCASACAAMNWVYEMRCVENISCLSDFWSEV